MKKIQIIAAIAILALAFSLGCTQSNPPSSITPTGTINQPPTDINQPTMAPPADAGLTVNVNKADANFLLLEQQQYQGNSLPGRTQLVYNFVGPNMTLNASQAGRVDVITEVYSDTNELVTSKNSTLMLQKGNQVVKVSTGVSVGKPGKYSVIFKLAKGDKYLYEKTFSEMLVGATAYPINTAVTIETSGLQHEALLGGNAGNDSIIFSVKATNTGNTDIVGYYKIEGTVNNNSVGISSSGGKVIYGQGNTNYQFSTEIPTTMDLGAIFLTPSGPNTSELSDWANQQRYGAIGTFIVPCSTGDSIEMKVSFVASNSDNPLIEGSVLSTTTVPVTCIGSS